MQAKLELEPANEGARFGSAVAASGQVVAVGTGSSEAYPGAVHIFTPGGAGGWSAAPSSMAAMRAACSASSATGAAAGGSASCAAQACVSVMTDAPCFARLPTLQRRFSVGFALGGARVCCRCEFAALRAFAWCVLALYRHDIDPHVMATLTAVWPVSLVAAPLQAVF